MSNTVLISLLFIFPLVGFLFNGIRFRSKNYKLAGAVGTAAVGASFLISVVLVAKLIGLDADARSITVHLFDWINIGSFTANASFLLDPISAIMILIITGVGSLIHLFSIGYMSHDERPSKYFSFLNLFIFNMLLLVLGDNLLVLFVGWEGVGLCSYLLIGFWFTDKAKAAAGMKAFITNRIGDAAFLIGLFLVFTNFGSIEFSSITSLLPATAESGWSGPITLACLFLFIGASGKSAQIPLYVWLPDAMAGPTPVSALIHAATMVTAGIYLIVRLSGMYILAPNVMMMIAIIGALTAFFAATIAITQNDIKKILAYSTVSQLGYMFLAVGVGAFVPAMFHLMTHAFFKALMFLGSGSVIHAMHEEQDIRKMGGLKKYMPITHFTFLLGWLAIIGIPPLAGFFSKDEILWYTYASSAGSKVLWAIGAITAVMTAFYMTRLMALTFWGESRVSKDVHPHESPKSMTIPLIVLGVLSTIGGWIGIPHVISQFLPGHIPNVLKYWLAPVGKSIELTGPATEAEELIIMGLTMGLIITVSWLAYLLYAKKSAIPSKISGALGPVSKAVENKYYVDEFYQSKLINPLIEASKGLWLYIDVNFIDKVTYLASDFAVGCGRGIKNLQNGNIQRYAMYMSLGLILILSLILMGS